MYEEFRFRFISSILPKLTKEEIEIIQTELDKVSNDYNFTKKETSLVPYVETVPKLVDLYIACKLTEGLSKGTLYNYKAMLSIFFRAIRKSPEAIEKNDIRVFLFKYQELTLVTNRTLDKYREYISSFFQWAFTEKYIPNNPAATIKPIKYETRERQALTLTELEYIRNACKTLREKAIIEVLYSTGCRVSELASIQKSDINWSTYEVHLFGKGKKHRYSFLNPKAMVSLEAYLNSRTDENPFLFVSEYAPYKELHKAGIEKIVRLIMERVDTSKVSKHVTPHVIRHTTATTALQSGMSMETISKLLGHENISTTMIYAKVSNDDVRRDHQKYIV